MFFPWVFFMATLHSRCGHNIFILWFILLLSFFLFSPNLSRRRLDVYPLREGATPSRTHL